MTDRQAFPFDGAGDFRGEPKSCRDDPPPCVYVCEHDDVCVGGCHQEGCFFFFFFFFMRVQDVAFDPA